MSIETCTVNSKYIEIYGGGTTYFGGDQDWYSSAWKVKAGCGPTNAALFCLHLSLAHPKYKGLAPENSQEKGKFVVFMEEMWNYVTPTGMGVYNTAIFVKGLKKYSAKKGSPLSLKVLNVPILRRQRPGMEEVSSFISGCLERGAIVPFLNNDNGKENRLYSWHWVSVIGLEPGSGKAIIADEGQRKEVDLDLWLKTTGLGGGFIGI